MTPIRGCFLMQTTTDPSRRLPVCQEFAGGPAVAIELVIISAEGPGPDGSHR